MVKNVAGIDDSSPTGADGKECLNNFKDRIDLKDAVLIGHSFGGATTILNLSRDHRYPIDTWKMKMISH